jgi:hypothetical protein
MKLGWLVAVVSAMLGLMLFSAAPRAQVPSPPAPATGLPAEPPLPKNTAELDALLSQRNYLGLANVFKTNKPDEIVLNMNWQKTKMLAGASAFVNFAYVKDLDRISTALGEVRGAELKKTAVMVLLYTYELTVIDGVKCKDVSAPTHRKDQILLNFPNVAKSIRTFSDEDIDIIVKIALKIEGFTAPRRADDDFLCRNGLAEMRAAFEKYGNDATRDVATPPGHIGTTKEVKNDPDYKPEFLGKEIWAPKQAEFRTSMPDILTKLVSAIRKR